MWPNSSNLSFSKRRNSDAITQNQGGMESDEDDLESGNIATKENLRISIDETVPLTTGSKSPVSEVKRRYSYTLEVDTDNNIDTCESTSPSYPISPAHVSEINISTDSNWINTTTQDSKTRAVLEHSFTRSSSITATSFCNCKYICRRLAIVIVTLVVLAFAVGIIWGLVKLSEAIHISFFLVLVGISICGAGVGYGIRLYKKSREDSVLITYQDDELASLVRKARDEWRAGRFAPGGSPTHIQLEPTHPQRVWASAHLNQ